MTVRDGCILSIGGSPGLKTIVIAFYPHWTLARYTTSISLAGIVAGDEVRVTLDGAAVPTGIVKL